MNVVLYKNILDEARNEALKAFEAHRPTPMIVGQARSLFGSEIIPGTEEYVADGVCGFAWVMLDGRDGFSRWMKKNGYASAGYPKGVHLSFYTLVNNGSQSMEKKYAACCAAARVFQNHGIRAYAQQRID